jgi:hypothetical protein
MSSHGREGSDSVPRDALREYSLAYGLFGLLLRYDGTLSLSALLMRFPRKRDLMAKISTMTCVGESGKTYSFNVWAMDESFNAVGAIYVITNRFQNDKGKFKHRFIYIGQTEDLSTRFDNHHKAACFKRMDATCICTLREDNENLRFTIETDLIRLHAPPCND